ncbi:MAG: branched-chain amino acid ABC transporter permease [Tepidisphaeraceae bacterium]
MNSLATATSAQVIDAPKRLATAFVPITIAIAMALVIHVAGVVAGENGQYMTRVAIDCAVAIIAAVSLTVVNGFTGQFSIGHAAFMAIGGYTAAMISYYVCLRHLEPQQIGTIQATLLGSKQWLLVFACVFGGVFAAIAGWIVGLPSLRLRGDYLAIVTLGFGEIVRVLLQQTPKQIDSHGDFVRASAFSSVPASDAGPALSPWLFPPAANGALGFQNLPKLTNLFWAYLFVGAVVLFAYRLKQSSTGRALLSIREDEIAAESMGVNTSKLKVRAFMFAAFFAGIAGGLYAHQQGVVLTPKDAGFQRSFDIVMMVVLGGLGSISGSVLAAIVITIANAWLAPLGEYRMILFAAALVLMMIFRPKGLFGLKEVWDVFGGRREPKGSGQGGSY